MYKYENKSIVNIISNENVGQLPGVDINKLFCEDDT